MSRPSRIGILVTGLLAMGCGSDAGEDAGSAARAAGIREFWKLHDEAKDHYVAGRLPEAATAYGRALDRNPAHAGSLYAAAHIAFLRHRHREARGLLGRLKIADPMATRAWLLDAAVLSDPSPGAIFDLDSAAAQVAHARTLNSEDSDVALVDGRIAWLRGARERATERFTTSVRTNTRNSTGLLLLAMAALHEQRLEDASAFFRQAEASAKAAPPPAAVKGEGDTTAGHAGEASLRVLEARHGLRLASATSSGEPLLLETPLESSRRSGRAFLAADLDGDGDLDVVSGSLVGPMRSFGNDAGRLFPTPDVGPEGISDLACGDLDGDGRADLYAARGNGFEDGQPLLLWNLGGLGFQEAPGPGASRRVSAVAIADVDRDGLPDLVDAGVASDQAGAPVRIWRNLGGRRFERHDAKGLPGAGVPTAMAAVGSAAGRAAIVVAFADRAPWASSGSVPESVGTARGIAVLDFDRDGTEDLVFARPADSAAAARWAIEGVGGPPSLAAVRGRSDGSFEPAGGVVPPLVAGLTFVAAGDADGDGWTDLVAGCGGPEPWRVEPWHVLRNHEGRFQAPVPHFAGPLQPAAAVIGDLDGDAAPEIVVAGGGLLGAEPAPASILRRPR